MSGTSKAATFAPLGSFDKNYLNSAREVPWGGCDPDLPPHPNPHGRPERKPHTCPQGNPHPSPDGEPLPTPQWTYHPCLNHKPS